jgi:signal transduction histidine kinase
MPLPAPLPWLERANHLATVARLLPDAVHQVNNVLQVISGQAELLESAAGASEAVQLRALNISSSARSASALLADLIAFAQDVSDHAERVTLWAIAGEALALLRPSLTRLRIDSALEPSDSDHVSVAGSRRILLQIVLNLVFNAEQALSGRPSSRLRLRTHQHDGKMDLIVEDNGPGLREGAQAFSPDVVNESGRLGIGLLVAQWLAVQQGGTLAWTTPEAGSGCRATLTLPVAGSSR